MTQPPYQQHTVVTKRGANHTLHIVLSIVTCGLWAVTGWPIAAIMGRKTRTTTAYAPQPYGPPPGQYPVPPYGQQPPPPGQPQQPPAQWPPQR